MADPFPACAHPPKPRCRLCQLAGRVPFPPDMPPPGEGGRVPRTLTRPAAVAPPTRVDCRELGAALATERGVPCGLKVRRCGLHDLCTTGVPAERGGKALACCATCPDHTGRPPAPTEEPIPAPVPAPEAEAPAEEIRGGIPEGGAAVARRPMRWAYGVTTVPVRRESGLLLRTLRSLEGAGFGEPWLFVDGASDRADWGTVWPAAAGVTMRYPNVRTAGNWVLSLWELWVRDPEADRYAIFQDDIILCRDVRKYLERAGYPEKSYLNLLTFPRNQRLAPAGGRGWFPTDQMGKSACGLVFDSAAVRALFSTGYLFDRFMSPDRGWRAIDGGVVDAMKKVGWRELCHDPSLTMHTGAVSSMGNRSQPATTSFPGEDFSALDLLG